VAITEFLAIREDRKSGKKYRETSRSRKRTYRGESEKETLVINHKGRREREGNTKSLGERELLNQAAFQEGQAWEIMDEWTKETADFKAKTAYGSKGEA